MKFDNVTTKSNTDAVESTEGVFSAITTVVRELSKKKPEASLTQAKVDIINRVLTELIAVLRHEPEGKYLYALDVNTHVQVSDALLQLSQFEVALVNFKSRYTEEIDDEESWVTPENIALWQQAGFLDDEDDGEYGDPEDGSCDDGDHTSAEDSGRFAEEEDDPAREAELDNFSGEEDEPWEDGDTDWGDEDQDDMPSDGDCNDDEDEVPEDFTANLSHHSRREGRSATERLNELSRRWSMFGQR